MLSTTVVVISLCIVKILAVDESCVIPNNEDPIENCCDLGFRQTGFSEIVNKPKVYKFKNFCKNCRSTPTSGYCDTLTDGGGWLVVQRRTKGSENFHRNWTDYEKGFGSLTDELWYGLRALHCLTQQGEWELQIDFTFTNGTKSFNYNHFRVGPATDNYRLSISGFTGITPTDPFTTGHSINGQQFSTYDRDNDAWSDNCALTAHGSTAPGGWWYNSCFHINLNYNYRGLSGFILLASKWYSPQYIDMKIRPVNCKIN